MPFPDSEYPSIMRGKDKRESQRLLAAAPQMLAALKTILHKCYFGGEDIHTPSVCEEAIAKAEGRSK